MIRIFLDGQYGSCGKGSVIHSLLWRAHDNGAELPTAVVRVNGPQAGHSILAMCPPDCTDETHDREGRTHIWKMRQLPVAWDFGERVILVIGRGAYIDLEVLKDEVESVRAALSSHGVPMPIIMVDRNAVVVEEGHREQERGEGFGQAGSTREGVGAARAAHAMRRAKRIADVYEDHEWLRQLMVTNTANYLRRMARRGQDIWIEGAQGFGLSLRASDNYPYVTSTDITPTQLLADCGLHWKDAEVRTTMLMRTFPIRIAGNSGPLHEIGWDELPVPPETPERTTVTNKQRRIGKFDWNAAGRAIGECQPDELVLTFLDYLKEEDRSKFISEVETEWGVPVTWGSTGFEKLEMVQH